MKNISMVMLKRFLVITVFGIGCLTIYNFVLEWSLDVTARRFADDLVKVKQSNVLHVAIKTYDWPRVYRKSKPYDDLHTLVITLLYLDPEKDVQKSIWGIRTAVSLLDQGIKKYPINTKENYFSRLKRISIINRMPEIFSDENKNINQEIQEVILLGKSTSGVSIETVAYSLIEKMFYEANAGIGKNAVDQSFNDALNQLELGNKDTFDSNKKKFEFYYGYAKCLVGEIEGGQLMLDSFNYLSQNSQKFGEAMFVNWDWPLIGSLRSVNNKGYAACHEAATQMNQ